MSDLDAKRGYIYCILREDLGMCYVGQSVNVGRPNKHFKPGNYRYDALCSDGISPQLLILEKDIARGSDLDSAEQFWMLKVIEDGLKLINVLKPGMFWPHVPPEVSRRVGLEWGPILGAATHRRREEDPEFDAWWRENAAKAGGLAVQERYRNDPDFAASLADAKSRGGVESARVRQLKRETDPEWAAREKEKGRKRGTMYGAKGGLTTSKMQRTCSDCGLGPTTPGGMGFHLKISKHSGYVTINTAEKEEEKL